MSDTNGPAKSDPIAVLAQYRDDSRPIWLWDSLRARILWANLAALRFWGEESAADLSLRDLGHDGPLTRTIIAESHRLSKGKRARRTVVLTPKSKPLRTVLDLAPFPVPGYRRAVLIVAGASASGNGDRHRLEEIFHHIPVPLTLFGPDGLPLIQNQAADNMFDRIDRTARRQSFFKRLARSDHARALYTIALTNASAARVTTVITARGPERMRLVLHRFTDPKSAEVAVLALYEDVPPAFAGLSGTMVPPTSAITQKTALPPAHPEPVTKKEPEETRPAGTKTGSEPPAGDTPPPSNLQDAVMSALQAVGVGIIVLNRAGDITALSQGGSSLLGLEAGEALGRRFTAYLSSESGRRFMNFLRHSPAADQNDLARWTEVTGIDRQNRELPLQVHVRQIADQGEDQGGDYFCVVIRDISDWKTALKELDEARSKAEDTTSLKSEFLANISHEIRTPLNAILGFTELMQREMFGPIGNEKYKEYLKDISDSGTHVLSLINDLLDISKTESGNMDLQFEPVDVGRIIAGSERFIGPQVLDSRITLESHIAVGLPDLIADSRALRQILLNLLSNAVRATPKGGKISTIARLNDKGAMVIEVRDSGDGMTEDQIELALMPYGQPGDNIEKKRGGTGLGLPLAKALMEAHGGHLAISSVPGKGTAVRLTFPKDSQPNT